MMAQFKAADGAIRYLELDLRDIPERYVFPIYPERTVSWYIEPENIPLSKSCPQRTYKLIKIDYEMVMAFYKEEYCELDVAGIRKEVIDKIKKDLKKVLEREKFI